MATPPTQSPDRLPPADSRSHVILKKNVEEKPASTDSLEEQSLKIENEKVATSTVSHGSTVIGPSRDTGAPLGETGGQITNFSPGVYAPQTPPLFYGGYENSTTEWDEYHHFLNADPIELGSPGIYNENPSLVFHPGYAYNPQMPYGPFSPVTTPVPSVRGDGPLYSPQQFPFSAPYYQQPVPPSVPYMTSPLPVSHPELPVAGIDPQGFDAFGSGGPWSEWSKFSEGPRSLTPGPSPVASPQTVPSLRSFSNNGAPSGMGMGNQQPRPFYRSPLNSFPRGYPRGGIFHDTAVSGFGVDGRFYVDKRRRGREIDSFCGCNVAVDVLNEQNKGPRASRSKNAELERSSPVEAKSGDSAQKIKNISYNQQDFLTEYEDAKFFIIKSYSEDNVHKSIKYGVWASTTSGNRRLDAAYQEAKEKEGSCPVFLLFSVNASAQFCGMAEMVGPVDFEKSVDYWQQDKWSGQFPVKWHLIKDVPNSQFRHIILENNDNKPVTNSRDTQEVKLEQGLEMLKIFKNYESDVSILDDFEFYEDRQKMMQERKARQQASQSPAPANPGNEFRNPQPITAEFIKQMPLSFAQVVKLEDNSVLQNSTADKGGPVNHSEDPNKRTSGPL